MEQNKTLEQEHPERPAKRGADTESSGVGVPAASVVPDIPTGAALTAPVVAVADLVQGIPARVVTGRGDAAGAVTEVHAFSMQNASANSSTGLDAEFQQQNSFAIERNAGTGTARALVVQGKPMGDENSPAPRTKGAAGTTAVVGTADFLAVAPREESLSEEEGLSQNDSSRGGPKNDGPKNDGLNQRGPSQAAFLGAKQFDASWLQGLSRDRSADAGRDRLGAEARGPVGGRGYLGLMVDSTAAGTGSLVQGTTRGMAMAGGAQESTKVTVGTKASGLRVEAGVKTGMTVKITAGIGTAGGAGEERASLDGKGSGGKLGSALEAGSGQSGVPGPQDGKTARASEGGPQPDHSRRGAVASPVEPPTEQTHMERARTGEKAPGLDPQGPTAAKPIAQEAASQQPQSQELAGHPSSKDLTGRDRFGKDLTGKDFTRNDPTGKESGKNANSPAPDAKWNEKEDDTGQGQGVAAGSRQAAGTADLRTSADSFGGPGVASVPVPVIAGAASHGATSNLPGSNMSGSNLPGSSIAGSNMPGSNTPGPDSRIPQNILDSTPLPSGTRGEASAGLQQLNAAGPSEMRFNLKTDAFGRVEMHTTVRDNQVGLSLSSERGDLRGVLGTNFGQLDARLQQHDLRLQDLRFLDRPGDHRGHGAGLGNPGDGTDRGQDRSPGRGGHEQSRTVSTGHDSPRVGAEISATTEVSALLYRKGGLSLRV